MDWKTNMQYRFNMAGMTEKLIAANVIVFLVFLVLRVFAFLFLADGLIDTISDWLVVPNQLDKFITRPWTIITYAFMHAGFLHILGNMIILYFSGRFFLSYFTAKRMLNYYFLGAIAGGLLFILSYNLFPVFLDGNQYNLIGASASVMAILVGIAAKAPQMNIRLMIFGNIKLWWIAAFFVAKDLIFIPIENPGGHIAHLGGAALGYFYTKQLGHGVDIGLWFEKLMDGLIGWFSGQPKQERPFKKVYKNKTKPSGQRGPFQTTHHPTADEAKSKQEKIDAILDKISDNGYDSLTKKEKEFLFNAGKD